MLIPIWRRTARGISMAPQCLAAIMEVAQCFSSRRHLTDGFRTSCIVSLVAPMEVSRTKELALIAKATCTAPRSPAGPAGVEAGAGGVCNLPTQAARGLTQTPPRFLG